MTTLMVVDGMRGETPSQAVARRLRGELGERRISVSEVARRIGMTQAKHHRGRPVDEDHLRDPGQRRGSIHPVRHRTGSVGILLGVDRLRPADDENGPTSLFVEVGPFCALLQRAGRTLRGRTLSYLLPPKNKRPGHMRIYIYMKMTKSTYLDLRVCESHSLAHVLCRTFVLPRMSYGSFVGTLQRIGAIAPETALSVVATT